MGDLLSWGSGWLSLLFPSLVPEQRHGWNAFDEIEAAFVLPPFSDLRQAAFFLNGSSPASSLILFCCHSHGGS